LRQPFTACRKEFDLSHVTPYIALLSFPLAYFLAVNPVRFSWSFHRGLEGHGLEPLAAELVERAERIDPYTLVLRHAITVSFIAILMYWQSVLPVRVGLRLDDWKTNVAIGFAAGLMKVALVSALNIFIPAVRQNPNVDYMRKGSLLFWFPCILAGAFAEEFWIAVCLVTLSETAYSMGASVALTAIVFGAMHFQYRFWGAVAQAMLGVIFCLVFLWTGSLIATCLFHFIGNLGGLYWTRRWVVRTNNPA
jgi:membrane protease YdiL (CAAX protease family)